MTDLNKPIAVSAFALAAVFAMAGWAEKHAVPAFETAKPAAMEHKQESRINWPLISLTATGISLLGALGSAMTTSANRKRYNL